MMKFVQEMKIFDDLHKNDEFFIKMCLFIG